MLRNMLRFFGQLIPSDPVVTPEIAKNTIRGALETKSVAFIFLIS